MQAFNFGVKVTVKMLKTCRILLWCRCSKIIYVSINCSMLWREDHGVVYGISYSSRPSDSLALL